MPGSGSPMARKSQRLTSKSSDQVVSGDNDGKDVRPHQAKTEGGSPEVQVKEEPAQVEGPARVSVLTAPGTVMRDLSRELEEEKSEGVFDVTSLMDVVDTPRASVARPTSAAAPSVMLPVARDPRSPETVAYNQNPPVVNIGAFPGEELGKLMQKNVILRHFEGRRVTNVYELPAEPRLYSCLTVAEAADRLVKMFQAAGYEMVVKDIDQLAAVFDVMDLARVGMVAYDLLIRHITQRRREKETGKRVGTIPSVEDMKRQAAEYYGMSREQALKAQEDAREAQEEVGRQAAIIAALEVRLNEMANGQRVQPQGPNTPPGRPPRVPTPGGIPSDRKPWISSQVARQPVVKVESDYLADIYDECVLRDQGTGVAFIRLRQSTLPELKSFDGKSRDEFKGKAWLATVRSSFRRDQLAEGEICLTFPELLSGPAKLWYRQLARDVRASWSKLQAAFEVEYCGTTVTPQRRYNEMRRRPNEEPLDYLYRLNVQAKEAGIKYDSGFLEPKEHVKHFIATCEQPELAKQLGTLRLRHEVDLREVLLELMHQEMKAKRDDVAKTRAARREASAEKSSFRKANSLAKKRVAKVSFATTRDESDSDLSADESGSESDISDSEDDTVPVCSRVNSRTVTGDETTYPAEVIEAFAKIYAAMQADGRVKSTDKEWRKSSDPCSHCGSSRHQDRDCWRRLTCQTCGRKGHPSDHCYQLYKGCGKPHDRGACPLEEIANNLKAWYDPVKHAGLLPASIEKWLN